MWKWSAQKVAEITGVHETTKIRGGKQSSGERKVDKELKENSRRGRRKQGDRSILEAKGSFKK